MWTLLKCSNSPCVQLYATTSACTFIKKQKLNADSHTLSFVFRRGREESDAGGCGDDDEQQEA